MTAAIWRQIAQAAIREFSGPPPQPDLHIFAGVGTRVHQTFS
ncbi:hypothetical protein [uncultured Sphingomonas sp.]|nr:hypothetical protein [uncultured Sphingomonas sp.]